MGKAMGCAAAAPCPDIRNRRHMLWLAIELEGQRYGPPAQLGGFPRPACWLYRRSE
jgi:hypothetical protein